MAVLGSDNLTLLDWAKMRDPNGMMASVADMLTQRNEILLDQVYQEGNLPTGHQVTIETGLPTVYYKLIGASVRTSKATTAQVVETCSILEGWSEVDEDTANLNGDAARLRVYQANRFLEAMNQKQALSMFYGSAANPEEYVGLANRYTSTSDGNGQNIMLAGGSSAVTSIWLLGWGNDTVYSVFPKGSKAGIDHKYHGLQVINSTDGSSNEVRKVVHSDQWKWKHGLVVQDWRYGVRIANVDTAALVALSGTQAVTAATAIIKLMARAIDRLPRLNGLKPAFYVNRTVASMLRVMAMDKTSSVLAIEKGLNQFGKDIFTLTFQGIPVRICDQITSAETVIT